jgi:hypothetical protein
MSSTADRDRSWEGVVKSKSRSSSDGRSMNHSLIVILANGTQKRVPVAGGLWNSVSAGDRLVKRAGEVDPCRD